MSTMSHPSLGELQWDATADAWTTKIALTPSIHIRFMIANITGSVAAEPAKHFNRGAEFLAWVRNSDAESRCRERVADDLLDVYNEAWADEDPEEGPPHKDRSEFMKEIRTTQISLNEDGSSFWSFEAGDLFAGHGVELYLKPGGEFHRKASLAG